LGNNSNKERKAAMRTFLYLTRPSRAGRKLARYLGVKKIRTCNSKYRPRESDLIINWGNTLLPVFEPATVINTSRGVMQASNKAIALELMEKAGVTVPKFSTDSDVAREWVEKGWTVVGRQKLRGHGGTDIILYGKDEEKQEVDELPLYTLYRKKHDEYRVHVFDGRIIDVQQKRRAKSDNRWKGNNRIRNLREGWIFARSDVSVPLSVEEEAAKAVHALGLTFGAADIGFSRKHSRATVYEVNTAPGLCATTFEAYSSAIKAVSIESLKNQYFG
jgi:glutathione synthase/RimK-type ligase-like ATP-grasp enzyme